MKIWKDKKGNKLTTKEFMNRWKKGISGITPLQKLKTQMNGTKIMLIGLLAGLVVSIIGFKKMWWVAIILVGALFNIVVQYLGLYQQKRLLENLEEQFNLQEIEGEFEMKDDGKGMGDRGVDVGKILKDIEKEKDDEEAVEGEGQ